MFIHFVDRSLLPFVHGGNLGWMNLSPDIAGSGNLDKVDAINGADQ